MKKFTLPNLPYDYDALEPVISAEIMQLHHQKHHQAYVNNLNTAHEQSVAASEKGDLDTVIAAQSAIRFNGGGHMNHTLFWENLAPVKAGGGAPPKGALSKMINERWGSLEKFIEHFNAKTSAVQGSGWGWLCLFKETGHLSIHTTPNQDPLFPIMNLTPLLGIDVWEHAYYLQYKNARPEYLKNIWKVVNWATVEKRYENNK